MQTIKPASKQLFCKPTEAQKVTSSGFYIADKSAEKPQTAEVINVGSSVGDFKQKDTIVYKPYATTEVKLNGVAYFLIDKDDVLGTVVDVKE